MVCHAFPMNFKIESKTQGRDEMIPRCWNSPFVPLTNRFSASDVSSEERVGGKIGTWEPSRQYKVFLLCLSTCWEAGCLKTIPAQVWCLFLDSDAQRHNSTDRKTRPKHPLNHPPPLSYWNIFTEYGGRKHLDLSQWVQSGSLFRIFSTFHTHGALWVMLKRSCVQDVDGLLIWNSFHSLTMWHIWYVNWRLDSLKPSSLYHTSFSILASLKHDSFVLFSKGKKKPVLLHTMYFFNFHSYIS